MPITIGECQRGHLVIEIECDERYHPGGYQAMARLPFFNIAKSEDSPEDAIEKARLEGINRWCHKNCQRICTQNPQ